MLKNTTIDLKTNKSALRQFSIFKSSPSLEGSSRLKQSPAASSDFDSFHSYYRTQLDETLKNINYRDVAKTVHMISERGGKVGKVWVAGNGGSASISDHLAHNLSWDTSSKLPEHKKISAISLSSLNSEVTARGNDTSNDFIFSTLLRDHATPRDLCIAISASGESKNQVNMLKQAKMMNIPSVSIAKHGSTLNKLADHAISIPGQDQQVIEDATQIIAHQMVRMSNVVLSRAPVFKVYHELANLKHKDTTVKELAQNLKA